MVWIFLPKFVKADSPGTRTLKVWILYRSHCGNSCIKGFTILGFVELPTEGKLSYSPLTTLALQCLSQNWCPNFALGTWTWTSWRHSNHVQRASLSTRRKLLRTWPKNLPNLCNRGYPHSPLQTTSQQRILELEAELAKVRSENTQALPTTTETPGQASTPIARALQEQPSASTSFDPSCLLVSPGSVNQWLVDNQPSSLTETQYKKWLKDLKLPPHKQETWRNSWKR